MKTKYILSICMVLSVILLNAQDTILNNYLREAAENNPSLNASYNSYLAALEKVNYVGQLSDPTISFGYFVSPAETRLGPQQFSINAMQMFPWIGTLNQKENVAENMAKVKFEMFEEQRDQLFFKVKQLYFKIYELDNSIKIIDKNIEILNSFKSISTQKFETGDKKGLINVLRTDMNIDVLKNKQLNIGDQLTVLKERFNTLLNKELKSAVSTPNQLIALEINFENLSDSILANSNTLQKLNAKKEVERSKIILTEKKTKPMLGLGLNYINVGQRTDMNPAGNGKDIFMPMLSVKVPLYQSKYWAMEDEAKLNLQVAELNETNANNMIKLNISEEKSNYNNAKRRVDLYQSLNQKATQALNILIESYASNGTDFEEILRMQMMIFNYDLELLKANKDLNTSVAKIQELSSQTIKL